MSCAETLLGALGTSEMHVVAALDKSPRLIEAVL
jgi:hypothetical protein